jgi:hypothetical protein
VLLQWVEGISDLTYQNNESGALALIQFQPKQLQNGG